MKTFDELYKDCDFSFLEPKVEEPNSDELFRVEEDDVNIPPVEKKEEKLPEQPQARLSDDDIQRIAAAIFAMQSKTAEQKGEDK